MSALDPSGPDDAAARVCAWADHLEDAGRVSDARDVLRAALDQHGDDTQIMVRLAELESDDDHPAQAAEILSKALTEHPGDVQASRLLAAMLLAEGRATEAAAIIDSLPEEAAADLGELAGRIYRALGQHAQAVRAFSRCGSLSRSGRRLRRRSWWHTGGPFGRVNPVSPPTPPVQEPAEVPETTDALMELVTWAECLSGQSRKGEARQVLTDALAQHGRHPRLLRALAELEDSEGAGQTALYLWCEAYRACPGDVDIVCGLARRLAKTIITPSYTRRVQDARRILDAFPEPLHPKVRSARADVLNMGDATSARIAAAYGQAQGLTGGDARDRRYYRRRSGGPLGSLCVHLADSVRGPQTLPAGALVPKCAESEEVARFHDSLRNQPAAVATERLKEAWQLYGRLSSLLLAYADVNTQTRYGWTGLVLAAEAVRLDQDNLEAACHLAYSAFFAVGYDSAVRLLDGLPPAARQATEIRVTLANIHRYAGNYVLAAAAYGDPRDLDRGYRGFRRRGILRGFLRRGRTRPQDAGRPPDLATLSRMSTAIAETLDRSAERLDEPGQGRAELEAAIAQHGRHPLLLLYLARASQYSDDNAACVALASEALASAPESALITAMSLWELYRANRGDEVFKAFTGATEELRDDPDVGRAAGQACRYWGMFASAMDAFGEPALEMAWERRERRRCWWRSGGPLRGLRFTLLDAESTAISAWPIPEPQVEALAALTLPAEVSSAVHDTLAQYRMRLVGRTMLSPSIVHEWFKYVLAPIIAVATLATLVTGVLVRWPAGSFWSQAAPVAAVTAALGVAWWFARRVFWPAIVRLALAVGSAAAAIFLLARPGPWPFGTGMGLVTLALALIIDEVAREAPRWRQARLLRQQADTAALSDLLDLLGAIATPSRRRDLSMRRRWLKELEAIAITLERYVSRGLGGGDPEPGDEIAARFRGLVASLRALKPSIALANESSWDPVTAELRAHAAALAQGDLGSWPVLASDVITAARPPSWWSRAMQITRKVLVIFGPPLVAFLLPEVVSLHGSGIAWLQTVTLVWALLGCILALDSRLAERITQTWAVLSLPRASTPPAGPPDPIDPTSAAGRQAPSRHGPTIHTPASYNRKSRRQAPRDPS